MNTSSVPSSAQLETKLKGISAILHKKKCSVAADLQRYAQAEKSDNAHLALYLHIALNFTAIGSLFYLFY